MEGLCWLPVGFASWNLVEYLAVFHLAVLSIVQSIVAALRIAIETKREASKQSGLWDHPG